VGSLEADVCVIGAGPAGLSVAGALAATGVKVVLLEAGDGERTRTFTSVRSEGEEPYPQSDISQTRGTGLGGTCGLWSYRMDVEARGCRYAPLDPIDFEQRPEVADSGWPVTRAQLDPWYARAQSVCGLEDVDYRPESWRLDGAGPLPLDPALVESQMFQFGPASAWSEDAVADLRSQAHVTIVTDANVIRLDADPGGSRVRVVQFRYPDGAIGTVRARCTVLAAGGIENSRLLLLSDRQVAGGLGNSHDQVGRYWMEHPLVRGGLLASPRSAGLGGRLRLYDAHWQGASKVMAKLSLVPDLVRREGLLSTSALLLPRDDVLASPAVQAFTAVRSPSGRASSLSHRAVLAARIALGAGDLLTARRVMAEQPGPDHSGWATRPDAMHLRVFELLHQTEQSPDPGNRVTLAADLDQHGRRMPVLRWRWTPDDRSRITRARDLYAEAFARAGLGTVIQRDWDAGQPRMLGGTHHHLGGTRMSAGPAHGVVDVDAKVHGVANLFVAGSSVFPGGGSVNPTLTVVALGLRLAAHLQQVLQELPAAEPLDARDADRFFADRPA
jgi:choline dehydrogenase-like flavoprotein